MKKRSIFSPKKIRNIRTGTLGLTLIGLVATTGCDESEPEYETAYTKGVKTVVDEVQPGVFQISAEELVPEGQSSAVVNYMDGRTETLSLEEARTIVEAELQANRLDTTSFDKNVIVMVDSSAADNQMGAGAQGSFQDNTEVGDPTGGGDNHTYRENRGASLGGIFFWGTMGYMLGRRAGVGVPPGVYANSSAFRSSQNVRSGVRGSYTRRPVNSRRGFFRGGNRSGGG